MTINTVPAKSGYLGTPMVLAQRVTYSDSGIVAGTKQIGTIPKGAFHIATHVQIETVSTAGGVLSVGTDSGTATSLVTAGDVNETVQALTRVAGLGVVSTSAALPIYIKWATATAGVANVILEYAQIASLEG